MVRKVGILLSAASAMVLASTTFAQGGAAGGGGAEVVLPPPQQPFAGVIGEIPESSRPVFPARATAPKGAPNVLLIMTDDVGFAASSVFGGLIPTPALDRLAASGLRYNNFHTTAMCSPSRAALLTGRNSHNAGMGALSEFAQGFPGYYGEFGKSTASVAEILRQNGYNTAFFGKHHGIDVTANSVAGPFDSWPTALGFDYFYGFVASGTDQWFPALYRDNQRVEAPTGEVLDKMLVDDAIRWVHTQKGAAPDKPFFLYLAPGTAHAPLQAPKDWIAKFRGRFDAGWDVVREQIFAQQRKQGVVPPGTKLTPRPGIVPAWDSLTTGQKQVAARLMEVYAAQLAYQDHQFGLLIDELQRMGQLDNTLVIFVEGDNGASSEGGPRGTSDDTGRLVNQQPESDEWLLSQLDRFGGPHSRAHYPIGWAWAMATPFQYFKRYASHLGGIRNGMVTSWPARINARGEQRSQFEHLVDVVPTILDAAGIAAPTMVNGVAQKPMDGRSFADTFASAMARGSHRIQYFEQIGNRSIYQDGWFASTIPPEEALNVVNTGKGAGSPLDYKWALYDLNTDFSQSTDLAARYPDRLKAMQDLWWSEAKRNNVLPINNKIDAARSEAELLARNPVRSRYTYWGPTGPLERGVAPPILNHSFSLTADLSLPSAGGDGVIAAIGDEYGGWSFYLDKGRPTVVQAFSQQREHVYRLQSSDALPSGKEAKVTLKVSYLPGSRETDVALESNGRTLASRRFANHVNMVAQGEGFAIGEDAGMAVTDAYTKGGVFSGAIRRVDIDIMADPNQ